MVPDETGARSGAAVDVGATVVAGDGPEGVVAAPRPGVEGGAGRTDGDALPDTEGLVAARGTGWVAAGPFDAGAGVGAGVVDRGATAAAGGAPFSIRVRSLALVAGAVCWAIRARAARRCNMAATIAPQPPNGKLRST